MSETQRRHELWALWSLGVVVIAGAIIVIWMMTGKEESQTHGIVIGGLLAVLPMIVNAIRGIGQSQAMQTMAEGLRDSTPVPPTLDLAGAEIPAS